MPEGSSSAAPAINPGPSESQKRVLHHKTDRLTCHSISAPPYTGGTAFSKIETTIRHVPVNEGSCTLKPRSSHSLPSRNQRVGRKGYSVTLRPGNIPTRRFGLVGHTDFSSLSVDFV